MRSLQVFVSRHELTGLLKNVSDEVFQYFENLFLLHIMKYVIITGLPC